ncbi:hypothetical protein BH18ACT11_BH18ACT11_11170 [soil metagenome]
MCSSEGKDTGKEVKDDKRMVETASVELADGMHFVGDVDGRPRVCALAGTDPFGPGTGRDSPRWSAPRTREE